MLTLNEVKNKSRSKWTGLHETVAAAAEMLVEKCYTTGIPIIITQGLRTVAEQNALYEQGRTKPGAIVTNARGGYSYHNYGLAIDFALLLPDGKNVSWDMKRDGNGDGSVDWMQAVQMAKDLGFEWGGDWSSFKDYCHLQMTFGLSLANLREGKQPASAAVSKVNELLKKESIIMKEDKVTVSVKVNGIKSADGILEQGVTYVPARALAEALGGSILYDPKTRTVEIQVETRSSK
ncbi:M15 family metallopeptidase [Paenibacillus sp. HN-1]|uniref:M15 family metallopeptidase n=1 Tax=Paenibacillus TaxID=44249 RepID=UPI001CA87880|nr:MULTISPECIES: M15 family metallopeptidase [Paenibacillus]MBY9079060.1 M15 family metallopeptidase [Paenibacillus sp. CGMCC 1.18879]MBY9086838.1 M15 family metallopeptidase [Paenibacillus sinensis]